MKNSSLILLILATALGAQPVLQPGRVFQGTMNPRQAEDYQGAKVNWHVLNITRGQNLVVRAESDIDSKMIALLPDSKALENDDTFGLNPAIFLSNLNGQVKIGFAFLDSSERGSYKIIVDNIPPATTVSGESVQGNINTRSPVIADFPMAVYSVNVPANQKMILQVGSDFDNKLIVIAPNGTTYIDDDSAGNSNARVVMDPGPAGRAIAIVHGYSPESQGAFTLRFAVAPPPTPITVGRALKGKITGNEIVSGYYTDPYQSQMVGGVEFVLNAQEGKAYNVFLESDAFDTFLEIKNGDEVLTNDDWSENTNSKISFIAKLSGPVYLFARPLEVGNVGDFTLRVQELRLLQRYQGQLSRSSQRDISGKYYAIHDFRHTAGRSVMIRLESNTFDTMLYVQDSSGERIAENDDAGEGNTNSAVNVLIPADGMLRILATNFGDEVVTGSYVIFVFED